MSKNQNSNDISNSINQNDPIYVTKSSLPELDEYISHLKDIFLSHRLTNMGPKHQELEKRLSEYLKVPYLSLMVNGHMAIELTLQAFDLPQGGEIITSPFTFISTTHAIERNGFNPVFADIDPVSCCISPDTIEPLITSRTVAIMPVHVYGNVCNVEGIKKLSDKYGLPVIYDAAHAFGIKYGERGIGSFGDASIFSFHATKIYNTIEGGAITFHQPHLVKRLYNLKNFGIRNEVYTEAIGANAKMNEFQAAMGLANLSHITKNIADRKRINDIYVNKLSDIKGISILTENQSFSEVERNYAYLPVYFDKNILGCSRDDVESELNKHNIFPRKYFYPLTNDAQCYIGKYSSYGSEQSSPTPNARRISEGVLTLPIYPDLEVHNVDLICEVIRKFTTIKIAV